MKSTILDVSTPSSHLLIGSPTILPPYQISPPNFATSQIHGATIGRFRSDNTSILSLEREIKTQNTADFTLTSIYCPLIVLLTSEDPFH